MTTAGDDLKEVNAALRELVRLQLAGELSAQEAWQTRRQMLDSVETAWHALSQDLTPEALASRRCRSSRLSACTGVCRIRSRHIENVENN